MTSETPEILSQLDSVLEILPHVESLTEIKMLKERLLCLKIAAEIIQRLDSEISEFNPDLVLKNLPNF